MRSPNYPDQQCRESVFLGWLKMLEVCKGRIREKERKLKILEQNSIQLECPGVLVFFSLFSFYLFFSCSHSKTCSPYIFIMHLPNFPVQPPFKNSWNAVAINSKRAGLNNHIPTVFERWLIWIIGWGHEINVGRVCFWEWKREKEREKKRENITPALLSISVQ